MPPEWWAEWSTEWWNSLQTAVRWNSLLTGLEQLVRPLLNGSIHEDGDGGGGDSGSRMWGTVSGGSSIILIPTGSSPRSPPNWMIEVSKPPGIPQRQVLFFPTTFETAMAIVLSVFWGGPPPVQVVALLWSDISDLDLEKMLCHFFSTSAAVLPGPTPMAVNETAMFRHVRLFISEVSDGPNFPLNICLFSSTRFVSASVSSWVFFFL